jgi:hypothetical protein
VLWTLEVMSMSKSLNFTYDDVVSKVQQNKLESKKNDFTVEKIE